MFLKRLLLRIKTSESFATSVLSITIFKYFLIAMNVWNKKQWSECIKCFWSI